VNTATRRPDDVGVVDFARVRHFQRFEDALTEQFAAVVSGDAPDDRAAQQIAGVAVAVTLASGEFQLRGADHLHQFVLAVRVADIGGQGFGPIVSNTGGMGEQVPDPDGTPPDRCLRRLRSCGNDVERSARGYG